MNKFAELIKKRFPNFIEESQTAFRYPINQWGYSKYQNNKEVFIPLKNKYSFVDNREKLIKLYNQGENVLYDAFLCTMVWGKIGFRFISQFNDVFDKAKREEISLKLKNVKDILNKADGKNNISVINEAFYSIKNTPNHISSVGPAFFTKVLYFIGQTVDWGDELQPLIYDSIMMRTHEAVLKTNNSSCERKVVNSNVSDYLEYLKLMHEISADLGIDSGHLEALLFSDNGRVFVNDILGIKSRRTKIQKQQYKNTTIIERDGIWNKLQNKISYVLSGKNEGFREIKKKFASGIRLRMNVYANGSQSISVCKAKKDGDIPQVVIDKICKKYNIDTKPHFTQSETYYVIKNKKTENANDDVKIDWFVENIQKIVDIL